MPGTFQIEKLRALTFSSVRCSEKERSSIDRRRGSGLPFCRLSVHVFFGHRANYWWAQLLFFFSHKHCERWHWKYQTTIQIWYKRFKTNSWMERIHININILSYANESNEWLQTEKALSAERCIAASFQISTDVNRCEKALVLWGGRIWFAMKIVSGVINNFNLRFSTRNSRGSKIRKIVENFAKFCSKSIEGP